MRRNRDLKKKKGGGGGGEVKLGQGVGALKKGGLEPPHELCYL